MEYELLYLINVMSAAAIGIVVCYTFISLYHERTKAD